MSYVYSIYIKCKLRCCLCVRVPFLVVRAAYRIYIDKHTTSIIMCVVWNDSLTHIHNSDDVFLEDVDINGPVCEARSNPSRKCQVSVDGMIYLRDLLHQRKGFVTWEGTPLCSCRRGWDDEVMSEFLMFRGRLWLIFVCFSGSSFLPQIETSKAPLLQSLPICFATITYICISVSICQDFSSLTFVRWNFANTIHLRIFVPHLILNWPLLSVNFSRRLQKRKRAESVKIWNNRHELGHPLMKPVEEGGGCLAEELC